MGQTQRGLGLRQVHAQFNERHGDSGAHSDKKGLCIQQLRNAGELSNYPTHKGIHDFQGTNINDNTLRPFGRDPL